MLLSSVKGNYPSRSLQVAIWLIERNLRQFCFKLFCLKDFSAPLLSQATYKSICNKSYNPLYSISIKPYDVLYLNPLFFSDFIILSRSIKVPYVLVSSGSDNELSLKLFSQIDSHYLLHWFSQNCNFFSHKVSCLPIGLEDCSLQTNGILSLYKHIRSDSTKMHIKSPIILYGFNPITNPEIRYDCLHHVTKHPLGRHIYALPRDYIKSLAQAMFVVSPAGNGLDCHRTWEALYLNTIPIVQGKSFYDQFPGFPGIVLDTWVDLHSITFTNIIDHYHLCLKRLKHFNLMYFAHWKSIIESFHSNS
jgi:hypothetical protein